MLAEFARYRQWNKALFNYFFPSGKEDAVLYLDENVLSQVGIDANINKPNEQTWGESFLSSALITVEKIKFFAVHWTSFNGNTEKIERARSWDKFVEGLISLRFQPDNIPAYFGMLCAIMYMACITDAKHESIQKEAQKYLGEKYSNNPGQLVDPLLQQLHKDVPNFNANRMLCGNQRHMSRIKYHLVLKKELREDFIDFLEVNNLKWEFETYDFYIDNILVPALDKAKKKELVKFVIKQENISYIKNILRSNLRYGKPITESSKNNSVQDKNVKWKYALEIDPYGDFIFSIISDYYSTPFSVTFNGDGFSAHEGKQFTEIIATNVELDELRAEIFHTKFGNYSFCNISSRSADSRYIFFEKVSEDYYVQVEEPESKREYLIFLKKGTGAIPEESWTVVEYDSGNKYDVYEVINYQGTSHHIGARVHFEDTYKLNQVGSWFSILLGNDQTIFWSPNQIGSIPTQIKDTLQGKDGKVYFRLVPPNGDRLSGDLIVRKGQNDVLTEQISFGFLWDGEKAYYHMNGWGEITNFAMRASSVKMPTTGRHLLQNNLKNKTKGSDILLQSLYDIADENGCVSSKKMVAALEFALSFNGLTPTATNKKSIIYALRRLGYMIAYFDVRKQEYVNQLISRYVERSNYSFNGYTSAYFVKGTYSIEALSELLNNEDGSVQVYRKRPYDDNALKMKPEYNCLPDMVLFVPKTDIQWEKYDFQMSDYLISIMENMSEFENKFEVNIKGDPFHGSIVRPLPCMVDDGQGHEVLCTKTPRGGYVSHRYYSDGEYQRPIPRHLARVYSQNKNNLPVCIMKWDNYGQSLDYARVSFVKGMGLPEVLDIALCDSNLGMPKVEDVFILNQSTIGQYTSYPVTERRIYSTNATNINNYYVTEAIKKLSARDIKKIESSPDVVFIARPVNRYYRLERVRQYRNKKDLLSLYYGEELLAFALGKEVFAYVRESRNFRRVEADSVNEALSKVYNNKIEDIKYGTVFGGELPKADKEHVTIIPIIDRQRN